MCLDLVPDATGLFAGAGSDRDMSLEVLPFLVDQQQNRPVETEPLAGGDGGEGHGDDLVHVHRGLQYLADFVEKPDFTVARLGLAGQAVGSRPAGPADLR